MSIENSANAVRIGQQIGRAMSADLIRESGASASLIEGLIREELGQLNLTESDQDLAVQAAFDELIEYILNPKE